MRPGLFAGVVFCALWCVAKPKADIQVTDLTPRFLNFYEHAIAEHAPPAERFRLWKQYDGFAAVPPTPEGDRIARELLDTAWPKYPAVMQRIEQGAAGMQPSPSLVFEKVAALLEANQPVRLKLVVYVGALEGNAFTAVDKNGVPVVSIPVEQSPEERGPVMAHEFTHAVQIDLGTSKGGWVRTVGETVLSEGLAMRVAQSLYPDRPAASFVETPDEPGWLKRCEAQRGRILADVRSVLASDKSDDVMRFTMGKGPSGLDREAYYAAWVVSGYWMEHGQTFATIARIPETEAPGRVREVLDRLSAIH